MVWGGGQLRGEDIVFVGWWTSCNYIWRPKARAATVHRLSPLASGAIQPPQMLCYGLRSHFVHCATLTLCTSHLEAPLDWQEARGVGASVPVPGAETAELCGST